MVIKTSGMGDSLGSKLNTLQSCCHAPGSIACRIRLLPVPAGATADGDGQLGLYWSWREDGGGGGGEQWPQTSKTACLFSKLH